MSQSPERMSSYRRHFEGHKGPTPSSQLRVSSLSPTRKVTRHRSASFNRSVGWKTMGCRTLCTKSRLTSSSGGIGTLWLDVSARKETNLDLDMAAVANQEFKLTRSSERQEMVVLNDRLAVYIEKVQTLESKNKLLEAEIQAFKSSYERTSGLRELFVSQRKELNREAELMKAQRDLSLTTKEEKLTHLDKLKSKYDEALAVRKQTESDINVLRPDVDKATAARIKLEKQLENLESELDFLQKVHKEEIEELMQQIYSAAAKMDSTFDLPDLSSALTQIQSEYDSMAAKNLHEMDAWYRTMFQDMSDASTKRAQNIRSLREDITGCRKDILNKERDLESLRTRRGLLEARIRDVTEKYKKEEEDLQENIKATEQDLKLSKQKTALLMWEYQDLLNTKMAMEIEITTYRKLIEGEDRRLGTTVGHLSLMSCELIGASASLATASISAPAGSPKPDGDSRDTERAQAWTNLDGVEVVSSVRRTGANREATETSEIKTDEIDEASCVSNSQPCTITITGAAEDLDEE